MKLEQEQVTGGGPPAPATPPGGFVPLEYINQWDPKLIDVSSRNIVAASKLGLPELKPQGVRPGKCVMVGSAPSVLDHIEEIRELAADKKNAIFVVNYAHPLMLKHGITPTGACMFEIEYRAYDCLETPHPDCTYYICSICDPGTFKALEHNKRVVWHCYSDLSIHKFHLGHSFPGSIQVGGGFTTFLRSLCVAFILGYRDYELFGVDSSFPLDAEHSHFFGTPDYGGPVMDCWAATQPGGKLKQYKSKAYLIRQADEFKNHCESWHNWFKMKVHGDGLLPDMHRMLQPQFYEE